MWFNELPHPTTSLRQLQLSIPLSLFRSSFKGYDTRNLGSSLGRLDEERERVKSMKSWRNQCDEPQSCHEHHILCFPSLWHGTYDRRNKSEGESGFGFFFQHGSERERSQERHLFCTRNQKSEWLWLSFNILISRCQILYSKKLEKVKRKRNFTLVLFISTASVILQIFQVELFFSHSLVMKSSLKF